MKVPEKIKVVIQAEGQPVKGLFVITKFATARKNPYSMVFGPTNSAGEIEITREQILRHAKQDMDLFLMDHGHLEIEWTGKLTVTPHNREQVEGALKAHRLYCGNYDYGPGCKENLRSAHAMLSGLAGSRLTATVSCEPDESVTIETVSVMA